MFGSGPAPAPETGMTAEEGRWKGYAGSEAFRSLDRMGSPASSGPDAAAVVVKSMVRVILDERLESFFLVSQKPFHSFHAK
jgi:hypothetical protein